MIKLLRSMYFYFDECDATLDGVEFFEAVLLGIAICAAPFVVKALLLAVHFGGI